MRPYTTYYYTRSYNRAIIIRKYKKRYGIIFKFRQFHYYGNSKIIKGTVGHEIAHALEGTEHYEALSKILKEYDSKLGKYENRRKNIEKLYKTTDAKVIDSEITADLVGEYLFRDRTFVNHLTSNRNLFQRIYDEIKHLIKIATSGSKEAKQIERIKRAFDRAYRENINGKSTGETQHSLSGINADGIEVYETSQEVINLTWDERKAKYLDILKNEYRGKTAKFVRNGHSYYATFDQDRRF